MNLLTILTWSLNNDEQRNARHHFLNATFLEKAQASYKRAILQHDRAKILRTTMRIALKPMSQLQKDRSPGDDNLMTQVIWLFRNLAIIKAAEGLDVAEGENDISRSATINAFHHQDVFAFVLAICSEMDNFSVQDVEVLDMLFHLVKGVGVEQLFMETSELISANTTKLKDLVAEEQSMHATYLRNAPSRHNRFTPMVSVMKDGARRSNVIGQAALGNQQMLMEQMDKTKKWNKPQRKTIATPNEQQMNMPVPLTSTARRHLRMFVEQFLDSSFNSLFTSVRKAIEREASRVIPEQHAAQYFYLVSWCLQAECARRKKMRASKTPSMTTESFGLVASVLDQETFVLVTRTMQRAQDEKDWGLLEATMKCFTQIVRCCAFHVLRSLSLLTHIDSS